MHKLLIFLACLAPIVAQPVGVVDVRPSTTQAILTYTSPDFQDCSVTSTNGGVTVLDTNTTLYPGSNLDSRPTSIHLGRYRQFVLGKRDRSYLASDGHYYSLALQAHKTHFYTVTCTGGSYSGNFTTVNPPLGQTYNDILPVDPAAPGSYAYPTPIWTTPSSPWLDPNSTWIDPNTGILMSVTTGLYSAQNTAGSGSYTAAIDTSGNWGTISNLLSSACCATYSGSTQDKLFLGLGIHFGATHNNIDTTNNFPVTFNPSFIAWCTSCSGATADDRTLFYALTIDGINPVGITQSVTVVNCASSCGTNPSNAYTAFTTPKPILADWFTNGLPTIDATDLSTYTGGNGGVNRTGTAVTGAGVGADPFNLHWVNGTPMTINGTLYHIASVETQRALTLQSGSGSDANVDWSVKAAGILVWRKTAATTAISIQSSTYVMATVDQPIISSTGDEDYLLNCAKNEVVGPAGNNGYMCYISNSFVFLDETTLKHYNLGRAVIPANGGSSPPDPYGWNQQSCNNGHGYWDPTGTANTFYCFINASGDPAVGLYLFKWVYTGSLADIGPLASTQPVVICNGSNSPCWTLTNLTPSPNFLDTQMAAFHPTWATSGFTAGGLNPGGLINLVGTTGAAGGLVFGIQRDGVQNLNTFTCVFSIVSNTVVACMPSWTTNPNRWAATHTWINTYSGIIYVSFSYYRGPISGTDSFAGNGPYIETITSGTVSNIPGACPADANSPLVPHWPTGSHCTTITTDGEPGDPTPAQYSTGTVTSGGNGGCSGATTVLCLSGGTWTKYMSGFPIKIGSTYYPWTYTDATHGSVVGTPNATAAAYVKYLEPVNNAAVGNAGYAYIGPDQAGDIGCIGAAGTINIWSNCLDQYFGNGAHLEMFRILSKAGTGPGHTLVIERGYAGLNTHTASASLAAGAQISFTPGGCDFKGPYPCGGGHVWWDSINDPYAANVSGTGVVSDVLDNGADHATHQGLQGESATSASNAPVIDWDSSGSSFYNVRYSAPPVSYTAPQFLVNRNPTFHGLLGLGIPNPVDSHPGHNQYNASANEFTWLHDARVTLDDDGNSGFNWTGSAGSPGINTSGSLWHFTAAQLGKLRPRDLPTMAKCGSISLLDVSSPTVVIDGTSTFNYKYCRALTAGECVSGSGAGDAYINCPAVTNGYSLFPGTGNPAFEIRDLSLVDLGATSNTATQTVVTGPDPMGVTTRRISNGGQHYNWVQPFWHTHVTPNGRLMFLPTTFYGGQINAVVVAKLPTIPAPDGINRGDYITVPIKIPATPGIAGTIATVAVQYGYNTSLFCTSRQEICVAGSAGTVQWASENPTRVTFSSGATVNVPTISGRVLYFRTLLYNSGGTVLYTSPMQALMTP